MAPSHLHTYPKVFNDQGSLKIFPFRRPLHFNFWYIFWVSIGMIYLNEAYFTWVPKKYTSSQFFKDDVT